MERLLAQARPLADGDAATEARILTAESFNLDERDPESRRLVDRALELARSADDPLGESAALDELTAIQIAYGDLQAPSTAPCDGRRCSRPSR